MVQWNPNEVGGAVIGGTLIALSTTLNLLFFGRLTGLNGFLNTLMKCDLKNGFDWKFTFIVGLITLPVLFHVGKGKSITLSSGEEYIVFDED